MSGDLVSVYTDIKDMSSVLASLEGQRIDFMSISLTNWDNTTVPEIAAGSFLNLDGSLFIFSANEFIIGTPIDGELYIKIIPSIDGLTATAEWTSVAPVWNDGKQGFYSGNERYVAVMFKAGGSYANKTILKRREDFVFRRYGNGNVTVETGKTLTSTISNIGTANTSITNATIATLGTANVSTINCYDYSKSFTLSIGTTFNLHYVCMIYQSSAIASDSTLSLKVDGGVNAYVVVKYLAAGQKSGFCIGPGLYKYETNTGGFLTFQGVFGQDDNTQAKVIS